MPTYKRSAESQARIDAMNAKLNEMYGDPTNPSPAPSPWPQMNAQAKQPQPTLGDIPAALSRLGIGFNSPEIQQQIDLQNQKNKVPVSR